MGADGLIDRLGPRDSPRILNRESDLEEITYQAYTPIKRTHLSSVQPYGAGPKAGEIAPEDTLKPIRSAASPRGASGVL